MNVFLFDFPLECCFLSVFLDWTNSDIDSISATLYLPLLRSTFLAIKGGEARAPFHSSTAGDQDFYILFTVLAPAQVNNTLNLIHVLNCMIQKRQIRAHLHPLSCRNTLKRSCQSHRAQSSTHHHPVNRVASLRYPCMIILVHFCTFQGLIIGKPHSRLAVIQFYSRRFWFYSALSLFIQKAF